MTQFVPPARMLAAEGRLGAIEDLGMEALAPVVAALSSAPPGSVAQLVTTQEGYTVQFIGIADVIHDLTLRLAGVPQAPVAVLSAATGKALYAGNVGDGAVIAGLPGGTVIVVRFGEVAGYAAPLPQSALLSDDLTLSFEYGSAARVSYDADGYFLIHDTTETVDAEGYVTYPDLAVSLDDDGFAVWDA